MDAKERLEYLTKTVAIYQDAYYKTSQSLISDSEYDRLWDELVELEKEYPEYASPVSPTKRVGSDLTNDFPEVAHSVPVLSLDKAYSKEEVLSFFKRSIDKKGGALSFAAEEKIDGISMVLYYEDGILVRALTRGNGLVGNDVTANIQTIKSVPLVLPEPLDIAVRGEVYIPKADFKRINESLPEDERAANARNLAAGTVRRQKSEEAGRIPLDMYCYEGFWGDKDLTPRDHLHILSKLKALGFRTNPDLGFIDSTREKAEEKLSDAGLEGYAYGFDELEEYIKRLTEIRPTLPHEIDGLVFKINELGVREEFGYTEHHPRWAIAYKFESPQTTAKLLGITMQVGRTGRITPVAEITPSLLNGSTIKRATLHNQEYIDELELALGDTVSITKRGDVIPAVEEVIEKNEEGNTTFKIPLVCPVCSSPLEKKGAHLFCSNKHCPDKEKGALSFFASRDQMDIESLGPKTVELLYDNGIIRRIEDIYNIDWASFPSLQGMGDKSISGLKKGIEESKKKSFRVVLSSLGIAEIGAKSAELLIGGGFTSFSLLELAAEREDRESFLKIKGLGKETTEILISAFKDPDLLKTIGALEMAGLHTSSEMDDKEEEKEQIFIGQIWCVTGSFDHYNPRSLALLEIEKRGGKTGSSITGKTTHLLCGKGGGSKKAEAIKNGITLVTEDEFLALIGYKKEPEDGVLF